MGSFLVEDIIQDDSPLSPYFQSNHSLPHNLAESVHSALYHLSQSIAEYDSEIALMERKIVSLRAQKGALSAKKSALRCLVAPVRRLPSELVIAIMLETIPTQREWRDGVVSIRQNFGVLRGICAAWRAIALSVPNLWRCRPDDGAGSDHHTPPHLLQSLSSAVEAWYKPASPGCPLDLAIVSDGGRDSHDGTFARGMARQLVAFMSASGLHWRSIAFARQSWRLEEFVTLLDGLLTPTLPWAGVETLMLQLCGKSSAHCFERLESLETSFPALKSLTIDARCDRWVTDGFNYRHASIRYLKLSGLKESPNAVASFLQGFPSLEELTLRAYLHDKTRVVNEEEEEREFNPITIPSLQRLQLVNAASLNLMDFLSCPSLNYLGLCGSLGSGLRDPRRLPHFLSRCNPTHPITLALEETISAPEWERDLAQVLPQLKIHRLFLPSFSFLCQIALDAETDVSQLPSTVGRVVCGPRWTPCLRSGEAFGVLEHAVQHALRLWGPEVEVIVCREGIHEPDGHADLVQFLELLRLAQCAVVWRGEDDVYDIFDAHLVHSLIGNWTD